MADAASAVIGVSLLLYLPEFSDGVFCAIANKSEVCSVGHRATHERENSKMYDIHNHIDTLNAADKCFRFYLSNTLAGAHRCRGHENHLIFFGDASF